MAIHRFRIEGAEYQVEVGERVGSTVEVTVNGVRYQVELDTGSAEVPVAAPAPPSPGGAAAPAPVATPATGATAAPGEVVAPISGVILRVAVTPGQQVNAGELLVVLEAMKMENEIFAPAHGTVAEVHVSAQQEVQQGDRLVTLR